jgi:hypothetical protein
MSAAAVSRAPEPQRPAQAAQPAKAPGEKPVDVDLFASLLGLVGDTHLATDAAEPSRVQTPDTETPDPEAQAQNPLAALLAWAAPGAAAASATTAPAADNATSGDAAAQKAVAGPGLSAQGQPEAGAIDITGMTPVVDEARALAEAAPANPASAPARPAFATPASRPAFASRVDAALQSSAPAMVWQRGVASGTDALQHTFASQSIQQAATMPAMHVRSTVAMDERFALASAGAWQTGTPREAGFEFTLPAQGGVRAATVDAGPAIGGPAPSDGSAMADTSGGSAGDAMPGEQSGQAHDGTPAEREAEGPTVSHWGTQHLRHASLRVGESGADAIDIQLSMKGQEVQVAFQSDSAEARASLREGASEALSELLQRSGIQLGNVSVGSQGQQPGGQAPHTPTVGRGETSGRSEATVPTPPTMAPSLRADGSRPLDIFV